MAIEMDGDCFNDLSGVRESVLGLRDRDLPTLEGLLGNRQIRPHVDIQAVLIAIDALQSRADRAKEYLASLRDALVRCNETD